MIHRITPLQAPSWNATRIRRRLLYIPIISTGRIAFFRLLNGVLAILVLTAILWLSAPLQQPEAIPVRTASVSSNPNHNAGDIHKPPSYSVKKFYRDVRTDRQHLPSNNSLQATGTGVITREVSRTGDWVSVPYPRLRLRLFLYSAYFDNRGPGPMVRVISVYGATLKTPVQCRMEFPDHKVLIVMAARKVINEHWKLKYGATFFTCPIRDGFAVPSLVWLRDTVEFDWSPPVRVRWNQMEEDQPKGNFAICVKPFHYDYNKASWLVEFMEFHKIIGVDHFFFYNHSTGRDVEAVLNVYKQRGEVTILPWNLTVKSQKEIRTEGLFAALNDCLYRAMYHFDYTIMLDFDEFIVPKKDNHLKAMVDRLRTNDRHGGLIIRNAFFYLYWDNDTSAYGVKPEIPPKDIPYMLTQFKTRRRTQIFRIGSRSKYIVKTQRAVEVGNHVIWKYVGHGNSYHVSSDDALLHHYRICEFGGFDCLNKPSTVDQTALRFNVTLLNKVTEICRTAFKNTGRCPYAPPLGSPW